MRNIYSKIISVAFLQVYDINSCMPVCTKFCSKAIQKNSSVKDEKAALHDIFCDYEKTFILDNEVEKYYLTETDYNKLPEKYKKLYEKWTGNFGSYYIPKPIISVGYGWNYKIVSSQSGQSIKKVG